MSNLPTIKQIQLAEIITNEGTQSRVAINQETVGEYTECMERGVEFPPLVVFHDGTHYYLADGFHRIMAAARSQREEFPCDVRKGTLLDAVRFSIGANQANGLPRNNEDKRRCVELALKHFSGNSDRMIAAMCGVSQPFVGTVRKQLTTVISSEPAKRTGKDHKSRRMPIKAAADASESQDSPATPGETLPTSAAEQPVPAEPEKPRHKNLRAAGMFYARSAIESLSKIHSEDEDRERAFNFVRQWLDDN